MSEAWEDLGPTRFEPEEPTRRVSTAEAVERLKQIIDPPKTEQQIAEELAEARERMRVHDARFADSFMTVGEQQRISIELARKLGHVINTGDDEA